MKLDIFSSKKRWKNELDYLVKDRSALSKEEVGLIAIEEGLDYEVTLMVLNFLQSYLPIEDGFPFKLDDDLINDYKVDEEDLGDFYSKILKKMSVSLPSRSEQDLFFEDKSDYTLRLAIEFIQWCLTKK